MSDPLAPCGYCRRCLKDDPCGCLEVEAYVRTKLEGPFNYRSGWSGFYDPTCGLYLGTDDIYMPRDFDPETATTFGKG